MGLGIVALGLLTLAASRGCGLPTDSSPCTRVLFIGNSYTFVNDLPGTFASLARSGGHRVDVGQAASGGWTLAQHAASSVTARTLASAQWTFVVLQEQSEIPSVSDRSATMYPAARELVSAIRRQGASPVFFETWAHEDGWPEAGLSDYHDMQVAIDDGYHEIAGEQSALLAPVGEEWSAALGKTTLSLWQADGSHPTVAGTYLAACVFYEVIFRQSPKGLTYRDGLPAADASLLQSIAARA